MIQKKIVTSGTLLSIWRAHHLAEFEECEMAAGDVWAEFMARYGRPNRMRPNWSPSAGRSSHPALRSDRSGCPRMPAPPLSC